MTSSPINDFFFGKLWDSDTSRQLHHDEEENPIGDCRLEDPSNSIAENLDAFMRQFSDLPEIWPFANSITDGHEIEVKRGRSFDACEVKSKRSTSAPSSKRGDRVSKEEHKDRYDLFDDGSLEHSPRTASPSIGQDTFPDLPCPETHSKIRVTRVRSTPATSQISSSGGAAIEPPGVVVASVTVSRDIDEPVRLSQRGPQGYHTDLWSLSTEGPLDVQTPALMTDCRKPSRIVSSPAHDTDKDATFKDTSFTSEYEEPEEDLKYDPVERKFHRDIDEPVRLSQRGPQGYHTDLWSLSTEGPLDVQTPALMTDCRKPSRIVSSPAHDTDKDATFKDTSFTSEYEEPEEDLKYDPVERKHLSWCGHGKLLTFFTIATALTALILAHMSKVSVHFAGLSNPLIVSPDYRHVKTVGLNRMMLCYNETVVGGRKLRIVDDYMYGLPAEQTYTASPYSSTPADTSSEPADASNIGCYELGLTTENVDDLMWNVSRSFLSFAIYLGAFLTLMLATSIFWHSINLKPIAIGFLFVYFFQSLSFFFFDSNLCREHTCTLAEGSISSILACGFWFGSGIACIRMDIIYQAKLQKEATSRRLAEREAQHAKKNRRNKDVVLSETESVTTTETPFSSPMSSRSSRHVSIRDLEKGEHMAGDLCPAPSGAW